MTAGPRLLSPSVSRPHRHDESPPAVEVPIDLRLAAELLRCALLIDPGNRP